MLGVDPLLISSIQGFLRHRMICLYALFAGMTRDVGSGLRISIKVVIIKIIQLYRRGVLYD